MESFLPEVVVPLEYDIYSSLGRMVRFFSLFSYFILFSFYAISKSVNPLPFERKRIITVLLPRDITRLDAGMMRQE